MIKPYVKVDIDLTVVDPLETEYGWLTWLNKMSGLNVTAEHTGYDYDLGRHFKEAFKPLRVDVYDWWRYEGIYDWMTPYDGVLEALMAFKERGYEVAFTSHCKGNHHKSKYNFCRRFFKETDFSFMATKEKHKVRSGTGRDVFIDDRHDHLNKSNDNLRIKHNTPWSQFENLNHGVFVADSWEEIKQLAIGFDQFPI